MEEPKIKTHVRWYSCELYSVGSRNYFGFSGNLYILTKEELMAVLTEIEGLNPMECANYLIDAVTEKNRFKKISY